MTDAHCPPEMQKVNTFTRADFLGSKNLPQNCVIHDKFSAIKSAWFATFQCETPGNSEKYQETVKNTRKQCETEWNSHRQRHLWFPAVVTNTWHLFTPPFTKFSTRIFTPVGKSLHEHCSHRSHLFASLQMVRFDLNFAITFHNFPYILQTFSWLFSHISNIFRTISRSSM